VKRTWKEKRISKQFSKTKKKSLNLLSSDLLKFNVRSNDRKMSDVKKRMNERRRKN